MIRVLVALMLLLPGCLLRTTVERIGPLDEEVSVVRIRGGDGTVHVVAGDTLSVERQAQTSSPGFELAWSVVDGVLELEERCPLSTLCTVHTEVVLPPGVNLDLRLGSGEVTLEGLDGRVEVRAEGLILSGVDLRAPVVVVSAQDALVELELLDAPTRVEVGLDAGDTLLRVPAGAYALGLDTGLGSIEALNVLDEPGAAGELLVTTLAGDIRVLGQGTLTE